MEHMSPVPSTVQFLPCSFKTTQRLLSGIDCFAHFSVLIVTLLHPLVRGARDACVRDARAIPDSDDLVNQDLSFIHHDLKYFL